MSECVTPCVSLHEQGSQLVDLVREEDDVIALVYDRIGEASTVMPTKPGRCSCHPCD